MKIFAKIGGITFLSTKLFRFMKNEYSKGAIFNKAIKTLITLLFLIIFLKIIIFILSPNDGWVSLDSDLIHTLEIEAEYVSAANKSYMLAIDPYDDSNISIDFMADGYQLYDKSGNLVEQSNERDILVLKLDGNEGLTISSDSDNSELIEYNLFTQSNVSFWQKRDTVFINDGYQGSLHLSPYSSMTLQTRSDVLTNQWEIHFTNSKNYSSLYCTGYIFLRIHNCNSVRILRDGTHTVSLLRDEYWYLSNITQCSTSLVGSINFKVASMALDYRVANQPLLIKGNGLTSILKIEKNNITNFQLIGTASVVELDEESLFPSVFSIIYSNLWGFLAIIITPFISFFLNIWRPSKKE
ncbi:MAG: hypothetical protein HFE84_11480 [Lachnospiraceae bacterium]|nr:hypothetical protein [Lachnospiraceae bacterium]